MTPLVQRPTRSPLLQSCGRPDPHAGASKQHTSKRKMPGASWDDLPDLAEGLIFSIAGIKVVGRISRCSKQLRTICNSHLELLVAPAENKILLSHAAIRTAPCICGHELQAVLWDDELCNAYALAYHKFPCITQFQLTRGLITEVGLAALALAIMQDTKRREELLSTQRPESLSIGMKYKCQLNLTNNNVTTLVASLGKLLTLETSAPWTVDFHDNRLKASEANYDALQDIYERCQLEWNERARQIRDSQTCRIFMKRCSDESKYGHLSIRDTPLMAGLERDDEKKHLRGAFR